MAGIAKPSIPDLGEEAIYELIEGNSSNGQNGAGLFDENQVNEWNTNKVFYWYTSNDFVKIKVEQEFRIWRSGTTTWSNRHRPINIKKVNSDGTEEDFTSYHLQTTSITQSQWEAFTEPMPAGTYVFGLGFWGSGDLRIDSEWYIESLPPPTTNKILLLSEKDNEIKRIEHSVFEVPDMTSMTSPSGIVKSSSHRPALYHNYMAFDGKTNSRWEANTSVNAWISYTFDETAVVSKYKIYSDGTTGMPKSFRFEVSNDEVNWQILDEQNLGLGEWLTGGWHTFNVKRTEFKSFRVFVVNNNGGSYIRIPEIQIEGVVLKVVDVPSQSEQSFIEHGIFQSDLESIDMSAIFTEKHYIQDESTELGEGKVFKHELDMSKILNKVSLK